MIDFLIKDCERFFKK